MHSPKSSILSALIAAAFLPATALAGNLVLEVTGSSPGEQLGAMAYAGDVNGDGVGDVLFGSWRDSTTGLDAGRAWVVSGADGSTLLEVFGGAPNEQLGRSVAGVGDLDQDGFDDVALGAPGLGHASSPGQVRIISGGSGAELFSLQGSVPGGGFGSAISAAGDLDGDGILDVLVGAPLESPAGFHSGSAYGFSGADGSELFRLDGSGSGDLFGSSVSGMDSSMGFSDPDAGVLIGATQGETDGDSGYVRLFNPATLTTVQNIMGGAPWDRLGHKIEAVGDMNSDGQSDYIVSSDPRDGMGEPTAPGYVYVLSGKDGAILHSVSGLVGNGFGSSVAGSGDLDGDGVPDFAVGASMSDLNGTDSGMLRVYSGANGAMLQQLSGSAAGDRFGSSACFVGDISGDGKPDIGVAACQSDVSANNAGSAMILSLTRWESLGGGVAGLNGVTPSIDGEGELLAGTDVLLTLKDAKPNAPATLVIGSALFLDSQTGELIPVPEVLVDSLVTTSTGTLSHTYLQPNGLSGMAIYYQFYVVDADATNGVARSDAILGDVP